MEPHGQGGFAMLLGTFEIWAQYSRTLEGYSIVKTDDFPLSINIL